MCAGFCLVQPAYAENSTWAESNVWTQHGGKILAALSLVILQVFFILLLLVQHRSLHNFKSGLKRSEERYRQLIETQKDLICRHLPDSTLTFVNTAYAEFFGREPADMIGKKYLDLLTEPARITAAQQLTNMVECKERCIFDYESVLPDGTKGWFQWATYPIVSTGGVVAEYQAIGRDIADRKRAEEATQNLAHALRLAVAGELTAMVAHEVSQPLGAIMANADAAQMLLDMDDPPLDEIRQILTDIRASDARADQAIRRIRALLRRRELQLQPLDINETVVTAMHLINGDALLRGIQIRSDLAARLPAAMGDHVHLQQVLLNLLVNAMDAMSETPAPSRWLSIHTRQMDERNLAVIVVDNGSGITLENAHKIFGSFFSTKKDGMGLGLAISRSIIEAHQGRIWAENNANGGATFQFCLKVV
jgi:PAS domain S-box-containing protein